MSSSALTCNWCTTSFVLSESELELREKIAPFFSGRAYQLLPPSLCPRCRYQRRLAHRNEWCFYHRKCDATARQIVSIYSPDKPFIVYEGNYWWGDAWDSLSYGRPYDFSRPFFDQFADLRSVVPRLCLTNTASENCEYTNQCSHNKNCYLIVASNWSEQCLYGNWFQKCLRCIDCYALERSELCYECSNSSELYHCLFLSNSKKCSDSLFCDDCHQSHHLIGCHGLHNASYYLFNKKVTRSAWERYRKDLALTSASITAHLTQLDSLRLTRPHCYFHGNAIEDASGDYLFECKDTYDAFNARHCNECRYIQDAWEEVSCIDLTETLTNECCGELEGVAFSHSAFAVSKAWHVSHSYYSDLCFNSHDLFGCIGLKKNSFCILNKQYTEQEYHALLPRIATHMQSTGEWGEFFPVAKSAFGYNESVAAEYFPLAREDATAQRFRWHDEVANQKHYLGHSYSVPPSISQTSDEILRQVLICEVSGKPYRIIAPELAFYRDLGIPPPKRSPNQRRADRLLRRNPRQLWDRNCATCAKNIESTFSPERKETVLCAECYHRTREECNWSP